jgi:hypothetical protein
MKTNKINVDSAVNPDPWSLGSALFRFREPKLLFRSIKTKAEWVNEASSIVVITPSML